FFQAEDGIRDRNVTGVQTCALPICDHVLLRNDFHHVENEAIVLKHDEVDVLASNHSRRATNCRISEDGGALLRELDKENPSDSKIGRASCRERVENGEVNGCMKRDK